MPVALAIRERGGHEAGELAGDGGILVVPGGARRDVSEASEGLAQDPLLVLSQPTQCLTLRSGKGSCAPLRTPGFPRRCGGPWRGLVDCTGTGRERTLVRRGVGDRRRRCWGVGSG